MSTVLCRGIQMRTLRRARKTPVCVCVCLDKNARKLPWRGHHQPSARAQARISPLARWIDENTRDLRSHTRLHPELYILHAQTCAMRAHTQFCGKLAVYLLNACRSMRMLDVFVHSTPYTCYRYGSRVRPAETACGGGMMVDWVIASLSLSLGCIQQGPARREMMHACGVCCCNFLHISRERTTLRRDGK